MPAAVFWETLRREWRGTFIWALGIALYGFITTLILLDAEGMAEMTRIMERIPAIVWQLIAVDDISVMASPLGFIALHYFLTVAILLSVWAILSGLSVTVNDEVRGISNVLVSLPLPRQRILVEKIAVYLPLGAVIALAGFVGLLVGLQLNPVAVDVSRLLLATLALIPLIAVVLCFTVLIGALVPRRDVTAAAAGVFVAVSFALRSLATIVGAEETGVLLQFSVFQHVDALTVVREGLSPLSLLALLLVAGVMLYAATRLYERRDLSA